MNYGLYTSASGLFTSMYRMDVASNNLANVNTPAFKVDYPGARLRADVRQEDGLPHLPSNDLLERLGAGTMLVANKTSFAQAGFQQTGGPLDIAIDGEGFLTVESVAATSPTGQPIDPIRLTRDGRLAVNQNGTLVTAADGLPVLDSGGSRIAISPDAPVIIGSDGTIVQNGAPVARLGLVDVPDRTQLHKHGDSLFAATPAEMSRRFDVGLDGNAEVRQAYVEDSGVDPIKAMLAIKSAAGDAQANARMIQMQDNLTERMIAGLGRVA